MISDCHVHTEFSGDSKAPQNAQVQAALELGMKEICITDHHDPGSSQMTHIDFTLDLPAYLRALEDTVQAFEGKIRVLKGIELGLMLREKDILTRLGAELPVDYIIGSSHFLDGLDVYDPACYQGRSEYASYFRYFESTLARIRTLDCFDSLGHLDYIVRYGPDRNKNYVPGDYMDIIDEILKTLIHRGKALECNTAGFKYGLGHPMGIFALLDITSHDLNLNVDRILFKAYGERFRPSPQIIRLVDSGRLGKKTGAGFYNYEER